MDKVVERKSSCNGGSSGWATKDLLKRYTWNSSHSPLLDDDVPLPRSNFIQVPHVRQLRTWDCGLACVLMVLRALGVNGCSLKTLSQLCHSTSIWTVDLAYLLRHFHLEVAFLTITLGANPLLAVESFYKDNMEADAERVNELFDKASQAGIQIQWRSILGEELVMLILSGRYLAIALVDKWKLSYPLLEDLYPDCPGPSPGYTGHYVVICGYDLQTNEFEIKDPSSSSESDRVPLEALEDARKSFGTDEDILLVSKEFENQSSMTPFKVSVDSVDATMKAMELLSITSEQNGSASPLSKRIKLSLEPKKEDEEVCPIGAACLELVRFKTSSIAVKWQEDGCPRLDFLAELGLDWLSKIQWSVPYSQGVEEFILNYDLSTDATQVGGVPMRLDPEMISKALHIPNAGSPVVVRKPKAVDTFKLFKEGACSGEQGFRNEMTNDPSLSRILSLIGEAVLLKQAPSFTSASFLEVLTNAKQGEAFNWPHCICQRLRQRMKDIKEKTSKGQTVKFLGGAWIAHFLKELGTTEHVDVKPPPVHRTPEPSAPAASISTLGHEALNLVTNSAPPHGRGRIVIGTSSEDVKMTTLISDLASKIEAMRSHALAQEESIAREKEQRDIHDELAQELQQKVEEVASLKQELENSKMALENSNKSIAELKQSEERLRESYRAVKKKKGSLRVENGNLRVKLEAVQLENMEKVRLADEARKKFQEEMHEQDENKKKQVESLVATVTELRTELEAKSFPYGANIWERVQAEAWKQTRAAHRNLLETISDLQRELENQKNIVA